jgi:hypothetical protein
MDGWMIVTGLICIVGNLELIEIAAETNEIEKPRKQRLIRYTGSRREMQQKVKRGEREEDVRKQSEAT